MKTLPQFDREGDSGARTDDSVVLAVYAPFGSDPTLSHYPGTRPRPVTRHPLVRSLAKVARLGIHVHALIDLVGDYSYVIEIDAGRPTSASIVSAWKQDMASPRALAGFLRHVRERRPCSSVVLALEGHGAGFLPDLDTSQLTTERVTDGGAIEWRTSGSGSIPLPTGSPVLPTGSPVLPTGSPVLPTGSPVLPAGPLPISTWGLGEALRLATDGGKAPLAIVHFNNCFNMSLEVLHTIAPFADFATGYCHYNFFTAGEAYPDAFSQWLRKGPRTRRGLATWFANANHAKLALKGNHPTIGGVIRLAGMNAVATRLDRLARELTRLLQVPDRAARRDVLERIRAAIRASRQYDTVPGYALGLPDQLTDVASLADALQHQAFAGGTVQPLAKALLDSLKGVKQYGDADAPWMDLAVRWDFSSDALAMNVLLPDPGLQGVWDWRSPYYLERTPPAGKPPIQRHVIPFLHKTRWIEFIVEYHRRVRFVGLLPALAPIFPTFKPRFDPKDPGSTPPIPGRPAGPGPYDDLPEQYRDDDDDRGEDKAQAS
jgi:hypothetical protein